MVQKILSLIRIPGIILILLIPNFIRAEVISIVEPALLTDKKITISGYIRDASTGEPLTGVTVIETNLKIGNYSNTNGFYAISVPQGRYDIQFTYIGYTPVTKSGSSDKNVTIDVAMQTSETALGEVVVEAKRTVQDIAAPSMSVVELDVRTISKVPSLLGEVDLIKVIQLMPGVQPTSEGSTGFSVRGGASDQNLILLDEATVYNASHLLGFFSVFNNDAVGNVALYKGDIPASYGGRLSSLLDVEMKEGRKEGFAVNGSIGTISSKITLEGPILKGRSSWLISGRRTYADLFLPFAKDEDVRDNRLYFYDLNMKVSHLINENNRIYFTGYSGEDVFKNQFAEMRFGNRTATLRWNHRINDRIFFNSSFIWSGYKYGLGTVDDGSSAFRWDSELMKYEYRFDLVHYLSGKHQLRYGASASLHNLFPGSVTGISGSSGDGSFILPSASSIEGGLYFSDDIKVSDRITLKCGLRISTFHNTGPATVYDYNEEYQPADSSVYKKGDIYNTFLKPEPRVAATFVVDGSSSVKASFSHTAQYISLAQNSTSGTPLDVWFFSSPNVKPQLCDQVAAGYFRNIRKNIFELSAEVYYKRYSNLIDFRDHAQLFLNPYLEGELRIGRGYSYGIETMVRKSEGRLSGWLSYTWSRSFRIVPEINAGRRYVSPYDKPHNLNIIFNYELLPRLTISATWIYSTGLPLTLPTGRAVVGNALLPIYSDRNSYRMEDYHRLDLSVTLRNREKPGKRWHNELNLSVYNAYNRHNTWAINFEQDPADPYVTYAEKTYLFSVIPALTYTVRFK